MTAIVGIINRNGAAFAADSAATHILSADKKNKITKHANKIFELSKFHPVGVAICGNLSFMGMLWEDIIKLYRAHLEKEAFSHIEDYVLDFIKYVRTVVLPKFESEQNNQLEELSKGLKNEVISLALQELKSQGVNEEAVTDESLFSMCCKTLSDLIADYSEDRMLNCKAFLD